MRSLRCFNEDFTNKKTKKLTFGPELIVINMFNRDLRIQTSNKYKDELDEILVKHGEEKNMETMDIDNKGWFRLRLSTPLE
jgi:hypothetical protein